MKNKEQQFQALVDAYHKPLYRYAYWLTSDESVAEDLVQETFMRAWRSLDSLQNVDAAKSWLITILRRENARRFQRKSLEYSDILGKLQPSFLVRCNLASDPWSDHESYHRCSVLVN